MKARWPYAIPSFVAAVLLLGLAGCGRSQQDRQTPTVLVDGSSTVFPISEAMAEQFQTENTDIRVTVGLSGTGGGFKKFGRNEIDIAGASRPIKPSEVDLARQNGVQFIELPVAFDGLSIVVNPRNTWCKAMSVDELKRLWQPEAQGKILRWNQIRAGWPDKEIHLFGAGVDSGTYDYFTQAIAGKEGASRGDYTSSEDDNVLVQGVAADELALGFFGFAYYEENKDKLKLVAIEDGDPNNGSGPILPSPETIAGGTYQPLSRPIFIYVRQQAAERPEVTRFVEFYIRQAPALVREVGYIPLPAETYQSVMKRFQDRKTGSVFGGKGSHPGVTLKNLMQREALQSAP